MGENTDLEWGRALNGELLAHWPKDENGDPELAHRVMIVRQNRLIDAFLYASVTPAYLTAALDAL